MRRSSGRPAMRAIGIRDLCTTIRSKQAGPFRLSLDLVFKSQSIYDQVKRSGLLTPRLVANLYHVAEDRITNFVFFDPGRALKVTLVRPKVAGDPGDGDAFGCQQHVPLLGLQLTLAQNDPGVVTQ